MTSSNKITVNYTKNGSASTASIWDGNSATAAADFGSTVTFSAASSGSGTSERWQANAAGTSPSFNVTTNSASFSVTYYDQLKLTVNGSPAPHDTPGSDGTAFGATVASGGTSVFYDRASTAHATLQSGSVVESGIAYVFNGWSGDASGTALSASITMNGPKTATANWLTDSAGPVTTNVSVTPVYAAPPTVTATVSDGSTGGSFIDAAEFFIDSVGANGTGTAMNAADGAFDSSTETVTNTVSQAAFDALAQCAHTIANPGRVRLPYVSFVSADANGFHRLSTAVAAPSAFPATPSESPTITATCSGRITSSWNYRTTAWNRMAKSCLWSTGWQAIQGSRWW